MTRTRIYLAWLAATALLVTGFFLATASPASVESAAAKVEAVLVEDAAAWPNPYVNVCYANDSDHQALETPEAIAAGEWTWTTVTRTVRAYYRNLGWEVYTTWSPTTNGQAGSGDRSYRCTQVFDGTIPSYQSGWDGVIDP